MELNEFLSLCYQISKTSILFINPDFKILEKDV